MADSRKISEMPEKATFVDADDLAIVDSEVADPLSPLKNKRVSQSVAFATLAKQVEFEAHINDDGRHLLVAQNDALDAADNPSGANEFLTRSGGDALYDPVNSAAAVQANLDTHKTSSDHDGRYYTEAEVDALVAARVAKAGDTMTGPLVLPGNPTQNLQAATKQYVDSVGVGTFLHADLTDTALDGHPGSVITIAGGGTNNAVTIAADDTLQDAGFVPEVAGAAAQRVAKSGDTMTGLLTLSGAPTVDLHAATKKYVDDNVGGPTTDELVKVSATDTTSKFLLPCLFSSDNSVTFTLTGGGGNETIDVKATGTGGGEANTGQNVGTGAGWYLGMNGTILQFKSAVNTTSVQWTSNANDLRANVQFGTGAGVACEGDDARLVLAANALQPGDVDLSISYTPTTFTVENTAGNNATVAQAVPGGNAGAMSGADKSRLDGTDAAGTARPPTSHASDHVSGGDQIATFGAAARGLVPASGGGTINFLRADGAFAAPPGGSGWQDGTVIQDWGETGQAITASGNQTLDLDVGHHFYSSAAMTADKTINFVSGRNHTYTYWSALLDIGSNTPTFQFNGSPMRTAKDYSISDGGLYWFTFVKSGTDYVVSERQIP